MLKTISAQGQPNGITSLILLISLHGALVHLKPVSFWIKQNTIPKTSYYSQSQVNASLHLQCTSSLSVICQDFNLTYVL